MTEHNPAGPLQSQLYANGLRQPVKDCPSAWAPTTCMKDVDDAPGS